MFLKTNVNYVVLMITMKNMNNLNKIDFLKDEIFALEIEKKRLEKKLNSVSRELIQLQSECDHKDENGNDMISYHSTDFTNDYYKCSICGSYIKK